MRVVEANAPSLDKKPAYGGKKEVAKDIFKKRKLAILEKMYGPAGNAYGPVQRDLVKNPLLFEIVFCKPLRNYLFFSSSN